MPRGVKRSPTLSPIEREAYDRISKADWVELYRDLYEQTHGEGNTHWLHDALDRLEILRYAR